MSKLDSEVKHLHLVNSVIRFLMVIVAALMMSDNCYSATGGDDDSVETIGTFTRAVALAGEPDGNIYVVDAGEHSVIKISPDGKVLGSVGGYGWTSTTFDQPHDITVVNGLDVYIADYGNHRIQRFDHNLNYVSSFNGKSDVPGTVTFGYPKSVAVSRSGILFIVDGENNRVVSINPLQQNTVSEFGGNDIQASKLAEPSRIRIASNDHLFVRDRESLNIYDLYGNYISTVSDSTLQNASAFAVDDSVLYVVDDCTISMLDVKTNLRNEIGLEKFLHSQGDCHIIDVEIRSKEILLLSPQTIYRIPKHIFIHY